MKNGERGKSHLKSPDPAGRGCGNGKSRPGAEGEGANQAANNPSITHQKMKHHQPPPRLPYEYYMKTQSQALVDSYYYRALSHLSSHRSV